MVPEQRRDIADPQPTFWRRIVRVLLDAAGQRIGVLPIPAFMLIADGCCVVARMEVNRINQIIVSSNEVWLQIQGAAITRERVVKLGLILEGIAEIIVGPSVIRL